MVVACAERLSGGVGEVGTLTFRLPAGPARANASEAFAEPLVKDADQPELSAEQLAERGQAGNLDAFEQLVLRFEARIFNFLHQFTRNRHDAEDLTQVTFLKAYRNLHQYRPSLAFAPWLFSIARHTAASHFRSAESFEELPADGDIVEENPASRLAGKDEAAALWGLTQALKPKQREALWLHYGEGFSVAETARVMHTSSIHVKVLLHRGRAALAKLLRARGAREEKGLL